MNVRFTSSSELNTLPIARAYLKRRAADAVKAYRNRSQLSGLPPQPTPIHLAQYLAKYW